MNSCIKVGQEKIGFGGFTVILGVFLGFYNWNGFTWGWFEPVNPLNTPAMST